VQNLRVDEKYVDRTTILGCKLCLYGFELRYAATEGLLLFSNVG